jgi:hypothetical protein
MWNMLFYVLYFLVLNKIKYQVSQKEKELNWVWPQIWVHSWIFWQENW